MYQISNRQYGEVVEFLCAYIGTEREGDSLREQNRYRRARLLLKAMKKRKPIS